MKVLLFNGSPNRAGCTYTALHEVRAASAAASAQAARAASLTTV